MKKLLTILIVLTLISNVYGQNLQPIERTIGKLHISIDPSVSLSQNKG